MNILIINVFSTENKGDAAIALSQIDAIRAAVPNADIVVQSWNPDGDLRVLPCPVIGPFFETVSASHPEWSRLRQHAYSAKIGIVTLFSALIYRVLRKPPRLLSPRLCALMEQFGRADLIVSVGGNFLYAYPGTNSFSFLKHCHQILIAQLMGKPTVLLAQSLGPVTTRLHRLLLRRVVNGAAKVALRETLSLKFLEGLKSRRDHVTIMPDTAFLLSPMDEKAAEAALASYKVPANGVRVGITVRDWSYPGADNPEEKSADFPAIMARLIDWMVTEWDAHVILLPQCISPDQDDRKCMERVADKVLRSDHLTVINDDLAPDLLKAICGRLDLFIGTRMHSNIFATAMSTPTLAISYQPKTDGIMKMLGMERWTLPIADLTFDNGRLRAEAIWRERDEVRSQLRSRISDLQDQAKRDIAYLLTTIEYRRGRDGSTVAAESADSQDSESALGTVPAITGK